MPARRFAKLLTWLAAFLGAAVVAAIVAFYQLVGFSGRPLEERLPFDTLAYADVKHLRLAALRLYLDEQASAGLEVAQALAVAVSEADDSRDDPSDPELLPEPKLDAERLRAAASHFKSQLAVALLPASAGSEAHPAVAPFPVVLARFHGDPNSLFETAVYLTEPYRLAGRTSGWTTEHWQGNALRLLPLDLATGLSLTFAWAVSDETFFAAASPESLKRILALQPILAAEGAAGAFASRPEPTSARDGLPRADLSAYLNLEKGLPALASWIDEYIDLQENPLLRSFSAQRFVEGLGLDGAETLAYGLQLDGERPSRMELRYGERDGIWRALALREPSRQLLDTVPLSSVTTASVDLGEALLAAKSATLTAAPVAAFPYIGLASRFTRRTRLMLDPLLADAFEPELRYTRVLEVVGSEENPRFGIDRAWSFATDNAASLRRVSEAYRQDLGAALGRSLVRESESGAVVNYFPSPDRPGEFDFAYCVQNGRLLLGLGSLRAFHRQLQPPALQEVDAAQWFSTDSQPVAYGLMDYSDFPAEAPALARALYRTLSPDKPIPPDLQQFDWTRLEPLAFRRASATFDDGQGLLYRTARQLPPE